MRKLRKDSTWNSLTAEQRTKLNLWLFVQNLGYGEVLKRLSEEFGIEASLGSLHRYYNRGLRDSQVDEMLDAQEMALELHKLPVDMAMLRKAVVKLLARTVLKLASERPEKVGELASLTKVLLESEKNELRRCRINLAERMFDCEQAAAVQEDLAQLHGYIRAVKDSVNLTKEQKHAKIEALIIGDAKSTAETVEGA